MRRLLAPALLAVTALASGVWLSAPAVASDDPGYDRQWALTQIHAPEAWSRTTGAGIRIGIVDTGVDLGHEDLGGRVVAHTSCVGSGGDAACGRGAGQDDNGHGTFVAGIAAASAGNGRGIAGVAPDAGLVVAKVLDRHNAGSVPDITAGIRWAVDQGAQVVNVSISDGHGATADAAAALQGALEYAWQRGVVPVVAAGNSDYGSTNAVVVTSTGSTGQPAPASGGLGSAKWGIAAPGGDPVACERARTSENCVLSTTWAPFSNDQYMLAAGSSAAAPHVAAVIAQLLSVGFDPPGAVQRLLETAETGRPCGSACHGVLNAAGALGVDVEPLQPAPVTPPAPAAPVTTPPPAPAPPVSSREAPPAPAARSARAARVMTDTAAATAPPVTPAATPPVVMSRPRAVLELTAQFEGITRRGEALRTSLARAVGPGSHVPLFVAGLALASSLATAAVRTVRRRLRLQ